MSGATFNLGVVCLVILFFCGVILLWLATRPSPADKAIQRWGKYANEQAQIRYRQAYDWGQADAKRKAAGLDPLGLPRGATAPEELGYKEGLKDCALQEAKDIANGAQK